MEKLCCEDRNIFFLTCECLHSNYITAIRHSSFYSFPSRTAFPGSLPWSTLQLNHFFFKLFSIFYSPSCSSVPVGHASFKLHPTWRCSWHKCWQEQKHWSYHSSIQVAAACDCVLWYSVLILCVAIYVTQLHSIIRTADCFFFCFTFLVCLGLLQPS